MLKSLALLLMIPWPALAGYDDPAIAVCIYSKFHGEDFAQAGYRRVGSRVIGTEVIVDLERSVLNTKPKPETLQCIFERRGDEFHLLDSEAYKKAECSAIEQKALAENSTPDERVEWQQRQDDCLALYSGPATEAGSFDRETIAPLRDMGIYPIRASETLLKGLN